MTITAKEARQAFGERLRNLRRDAGLTGRRLSELAGWPGSKVSKIEYGNQTPTDDDVRAWWVMNNFIMFDNRMVQVETISAELTFTQPSEIALYDKAFHTLKEQAVHGQGARAMIAAAMAR